MQFLEILKQNEIKWITKELFKDNNNRYCNDMSLGWPLENITRAIKTSQTEQMDHQILTDAICSRGKVLMTSHNHQDLIETEKLEPLLRNLNLTSNLKNEKDWMHNLVIDRNSLTHLTTNKEVICQTNSYIQKVFRQLESVLDSWSILWDKVNMFEQLLFKKVNEDNGSELLDF